MNKLHLYENNIKYSDLIKKLKNEVEKYKVETEELEKECIDEGIISKLNRAIDNLEDPNNSKQAIKAAKQYNKMDKIIIELLSLGLPLLCCLEISRQILDKDLKGSKPLIIKD